VGEINKTVYYLSEPPSALVEALTPNNQTPYASTFLNTKNGPIVMEVPPATADTAIFGSAIDTWQVPLVDIGPFGEDKGLGGKYLFIPPNYEGDIPDGYIPVTSDLYNVFVALRLIPLGETSYKEAAEYAKNINVYPLSNAVNPPVGQYIDMASKHLPTLPTYDIRFFETVSELLDEEPLLERDKVMGGMLASLGLKKGQTFAPEGKVKTALEKAAYDGFAYLEYTFETPGLSTETFWQNTNWMTVKIPSEDGIVFDEGEYLLLDERGSMFHWLTFLPRNLGKATAYVLSMKDDEGQLLSGRRNYKLHLPADIPAKNFWSVIAYGKKTKSFIYNDEEIVGLSSYDTLQKNEDGTIDIYFGKTAPAGLKSNWIPTAGEDFFLLFRIYGPEDAYFDKSFSLNDIERI
jgi:hypothetical protein